MSSLKCCDTKCRWGGRIDILNQYSEAVTGAGCTRALHQRALLSLHVMGTVMLVQAQGCV